MRLALLALALAALVLGCGGNNDDAEGSGAATTQAITFNAETGNQGEELLDLGGLTLTGYCQRAAGQIHLAVTAATATDDAVLGSRFSQRDSPCTFVLDDFDRNFGEYDVMGKASDETAGTLTYMPVGGGQVVVDYVAVEETAQGDCAFGGVATHAPQRELGSKESPRASPVCGADPSSLPHTRVDLRHVAPLVARAPEGTTRVLGRIAAEPG